MKPRQRLDFERDFELARHRMREERATRELQTLERLMKEQDRALRALISPVATLRPEEEVFGYVRRLMECIINILKNLNEMREKRASIHIWTSRESELA